MEKLRLIALLGKAGAGKDLAGSILCEDGRGQTLAFADKLKQICMEMFGLSEADCYTQEGKVKPTNLPCMMCPTCGSVLCEEIVLDKVKHGSCRLCGAVGDIKVFATKWTPRTILQYVGTEGFRAIDPQVWVRYAVNEAKRRLGDDAEFVVITDCRFRSEAQAIWAAGGEVWRIKRPSLEAGTVGISGHASEMEQDSISDSECQAVIVNDSTIDNLRGNLNVQLQRFLSR